MISRIFKTQVLNVVSPCDVCIYFIHLQAPHFCDRAWWRKSFCTIYTLLSVFFQMASTWWGHLPHVIDNGTAHEDNSSCFSAMQNTVLKGVNFGGVPIVLLLDFIVFLVSSLCVYDSVYTDYEVWCNRLLCTCVQVLLLIFTVIRRNLWDYGRLALVAETEGYVTWKHNYMY